MNNQQPSMHLLDAEDAEEQNNTTKAIIADFSVIMCLVGPGLTRQRDGQRGADPAARATAGAGAGAGASASAGCLTRCFV